MRKIIAATAVSAASLAVLGGAVACTSPTISKAAPPPAASKPAAMPSAPAPAPSTPSPANTGPLYTTFTATGTDDNGNPMSYDVTMTAIDQHATLAQYETLSTPGDHMAAARFVIKDDTGLAADDADSDAIAVGSDGQDYTSSVNDVTDGTNFNYGDFSVQNGAQVSGWVSFELPSGVTVASVQWNPNSMMGSAAATWNVS